MNLMLKKENPCRGGNDNSGCNLSWQTSGVSQGVNYHGKYLLDYTKLLFFDHHFHKLLIYFKCVVLTKPPSVSSHPLYPIAITRYEKLGTPPTTERNEQKEKFQFAKQNSKKKKI